MAGKVNDRVKIALAQFSPAPGNKEHNLGKARKYLAMAAEESADIILLPEMFLTGYLVENLMKEIAEPISGKSIQYLQESAAKYKVAIVGSFMEWDPRQNCLYNTAVFISADGKTIGTFHKIHLFNQEKSYVNAGKELVMLNYKGINYGILICFDIEFPEAARLLALQGTEVLLVVSANMDPYGPFHRNFVISRARENHIFVAYCNQTGGDDNFNFVGESCLVNPSGDIICELGNEEGITFGSVQLSEIGSSQNVYNYLTEREITFNPCREWFK